MKLYVFQFRSEDVHFAAIFKNDLIVEMIQCFFSLWGVVVLDKGFPDLCFLEDEYFDDGSVWAKELVEVVMGDYITELVVDADQEDGTLWCVVFVVAHVL